MLKYQIVLAGVGIAYDEESASEAATVATRVMDATDVRIALEKI
jgi:hypothetical protein